MISGALGSMADGIVVGIRDSALLLKSPSFGLCVAHRLSLVTPFVTEESTIDACFTSTGFQSRLRDTLLRLVRLPVACDILSRVGFEIITSFKSSTEIFGKSSASRIALLQTKTWVSLSLCNFRKCPTVLSDFGCLTSNASDLAHNEPAGLTSFSCRRVVSVGPGPRTRSPEQ